MLQVTLARVSPRLLSKHLQVPAPLSSLTLTLHLELMEVWPTHSQESTCHSAVSLTSSSLSNPIHSPLVSSPPPPHHLLIHPCPSCQSFFWHQKPSTLFLTQCPLRYDPPGFIYIYSHFCLHSQQFPIHRSSCLCKDFQYPPSRRGMEPQN